MEFFERNLLNELKKWINRKEILVIKGPRQSGKTTLLKMLKECLIKEKNVNENNILFITFEDRELLESFNRESNEFVRRYVRNHQERYYFMIDEAQYCKDIGQKLKLLYDVFDNIKFIITGSSSLELGQQTAKFLVGRMFSFELLPLNFYEFINMKDSNLAKIYLEKNITVRNLIFNSQDFKIAGEDIFIKELLKYLEEYLLFGGYPEVVKASGEEEKKIVLKNIFNTYIEKDILAFLQISDTAKFRNLVSILSVITGNLVSYESICSQSNVYFKELMHLVNVLEQTYIIKFIRPFHKNLITELRKTPKVYFIDYGLRNYAINNFNKLDMRDDAGRLAENFIFNQLSKEEVVINFWRTASKAEVDFIINQIPLEVKFSKMTKPKITRSFHSFLTNYLPKTAIVATKDYWEEINENKTMIKFIPIVYF